MFHTYIQSYINLRVDWDFLLTIFVNDTNSYQEDLSVCVSDYLKDYEKLVCRLKDRSKPSWVRYCANSIYTNIDCSVVLRVRLLNMKLRDWLCYRGCCDVLD